MVEKVFHFTNRNEKTVEKIVFDENVHYLHMIFNKNEGLPEHFSNSNVYMSVLRGTLSIRLNEQDVHKYEAGTVLKIPNNTKMNVNNFDEQLLEITVVKAPAPQNLEFKGESK